jgi:hypothetical protein
MAFAAVGAASSLIGFALNTKRAADTLREMAQHPGASDGYVLWQLIESTAAPLELATELAARHRTAPLVGAAVALTRHTLGECERLFEEERAEDGGGGGGSDGVEEGHGTQSDSDESWMAWLAQKKDGVERRDLVKELCRRLGMGQQALQLGLQAVALRYPRAGLAGSHQQPFSYLPAAVETARVVIEEFECGRTRCRRLFLAQHWVFASSATRHDSREWRDQGIVDVSLVLTAEDRLALKLTETAAADDDDDDDTDRAVGSGGGHRSRRTGAVDMAARMAALSVHGTDAPPEDGPSHDPQQLLRGQRGGVEVVLGGEDATTSCRRGPIAGFIGEESCPDESGSGGAGGGALAYQLVSASAPFCLRFIPASKPSGVSAEVFEVLVCLCARKAGALEPALAVVFDQAAENQSEASPSLLQELEQIGPYEAPARPSVPASPLRPLAREGGFVTPTASGALGSRPTRR